MCTNVWRTTGTRARPFSVFSHRGLPSSITASHPNSIFSSFHPEETLVPVCTSEYRRRNKLSCWIVSNADPTSHAFNTDHHRLGKSVDHAVVVQQSISNVPYIKIMFSKPASWDRNEIWFLSFDSFKRHIVIPPLGSSSICFILLHPLKTFSSHVHPVLWRWNPASTGKISSGVMFPIMPCCNSNDSIKDT